MNSTERSEKTRRQIEGNDPDLGKLHIGCGHNGYLPLNGDWGRDGEAIGRNEFIKELRFGSELYGTNRDTFEAFCGGIVGNKSIERLEIDCCTLYGGEIFTILKPFFEQNSSLRCLVVRFSFGGTINKQNSVRLLSESLSNFNTLREFDFNGGRFRDDNVEALIRALADHSQLIKIGLSGNQVGRRGLDALAALLTNPNSSLVDLNLAYCSLDDERALALAGAMATNSTLRKLNLADNRGISTAGWKDIFAQMQSPQSLVEDLLLSTNSIDDTAGTMLANVLATSTSLKVLDLSSSRNITNEGWRATFDALQNPRCMLQKLYLHDNLNDENVTYLANSLANNCVLRELDLSINAEVTSSGWRTFAAVLQNPNSALEKVDLQCNTINDGVLVSFANSLVHNSKLKELFLDYFQDITTTGWEPLSNVLCGKLSVNSTFNSNHTLHRIFVQCNESQLPSDLNALLQLNRENNKAEAARRKILKVHFNGDFNMQPFIDMDLKVLPRAISWMARDECGSSLLYKFVRNTTLFLGISGAF